MDLSKCIYLCCVACLCVHTPFDFSVIVFVNLGRLYLYKMICLTCLYICIPVNHFDLGGIILTVVYIIHIYVTVNLYNQVIRVLLTEI